MPSRQEAYGLTRHPPSAGPSSVESRLMMIGWPVRGPRSIRSARGALTTPPRSPAGIWPRRRPGCVTWLLLAHMSGGYE